MVQYPMLIIIVEITDSVRCFADQVTASIIIDVKQTFSSRIKEKGTMDKRRARSDIMTANITNQSWIMNLLPCTGQRQCVCSIGMLFHIFRCTIAPQAIAEGRGLQVLHKSTMHDRFPTACSFVGTDLHDPCNKVRWSMDGFE